MTVSTVNNKPVSDSAKTTSAQDVRLNVTGVDVKGQMFRHSATVLILDGRDCVIRSKSEPELGGSMLAEFDYSGANPQRRTSQARIKSSQAEPDSGTFKVVVELEFAQSAKVGSKEAEPGPALKKSTLQFAPAAVITPVEDKVVAPAAAAPAEKKIVSPVVAEPAEKKYGPAEASREFPFPIAAKSSDIAPAPQHSNNAEIPAPKLESRETPPKAQAFNATAYQESIKSAVSTEIKHEINLIKGSLSSEVEKALPPIVALKLEKMIREDLEKLISTNYESSMQTLNANVSRQVAERLAETQGLRGALEVMARDLFEEQGEHSRATADRAEQELNARMTGMVRSLEQSMAAMEARIEATRADAELALAKVQGIKQEINEGINLVQEGLKQLRDAEQPGIEKMQAQAAAQMKEWSAQFETLLNRAGTDKVVKFSLDVERRMAPHRQRAEETSEKLAAMLQLLQGTARVEQERLSEHARGVADGIEKEIQSFLVRLGSGITEEGV